MIAAHLRIFGIVHIFWLAACEVVEYKGLGVRKQRILQFLDALFTKMRCNLDARDFSDEVLRDLNYLDVKERAGGISFEESSERLYFSGGVRNGSDLGLRIWL